MEVLILLLPGIGLGTPGVIGVASPLRQLSRLRELSTGRLLLVSHTLIVLLFILAAPLYIAAEWGSPYGDVYGPYLLVPGVHIYYPANVLFGRAVFPWLLGYMESFPASVLCIVVGPGAVGLLAGGLQWYMFGCCWDRLTGKPGV